MVHWAMDSNPYFSQIVCIHSERCHDAEGIPHGVIYPTGTMSHKGIMLQAETQKESGALLPGILDKAFTSEL
jgi:hypothetical protein